MTENKIARRLPPCNRKVGACGKVGAAKSGAVKLERAVKQAADGRSGFFGTFFDKHKESTYKS